MEPEAVYLGYTLDQWFNSHPPVSEEHKARYAAVNNLCRRAADDHEFLMTKFQRMLLQYVTIPEIKEWIKRTWNYYHGKCVFGGPIKMFLIQQMRMFANLSITLEELPKCDTSQLKPSKLSQPALPDATAIIPRAPKVIPLSIPMDTLPGAPRKSLKSTITL